MSCTQGLLFRFALPSYLLNGAPDTLLDGGLLLTCEGFYLGDFLFRWSVTEGDVSKREPPGGVVGIVSRDAMRTFIGRMGCTHGVGGGSLRHALL